MLTVQLRDRFLRDVDAVTGDPAVTAALKPAAESRNGA
jgi:hypothetical protein